MKISLIRPDDLDDTLRARWTALRSQHAHGASPYFTAAFTIETARARPNTRIAVLEDGREIVGFFPYERGPLGSMQPVAGLLSDHHGAITAPHVVVDWRAILRAAGAQYWRFDHLTGSQAPRDAVAMTPCTSPALDLSRGYAAYREGRRESRMISELDRKARKLAREIGPLRFVALSRDRDDFERVLAWKSQQCQRTGAVDYFERMKWTRALVERIWALDEPELAGALSVLYAGDRMVAANLGMRTRDVWHWWFPVYDQDLGKYSPGAIFLLRVAEAAAEHDAKLLDLGKGTEAYKATFADTHLPIAEGVIARSSIVATAHELGVRAEQHVRSSSVFTQIKPALQALKRFTVARRST